LTPRAGVPRLPKMPKFRVIEGRPDESPAGQVRKRSRASARDWPACSHCGGREVIAAKIGNVTNKLCVCCLTQGRRVVV
jgi:hypothetical protein